MAETAFALAADLIRCRSVTPADDGALGVVAGRLEPLGFVCHRLRFAEDGAPPVDNLYARLGTAAPNFCFAGHTDVVPAGDAGAWHSDPFGAAIEGAALWGRGAVDMKGAVGCFVAAVERFLAARGPGFGGSISVLLTGDEEGPAVNGTRKVLAWLAERGERLDGCVVGEPTCFTHLGDNIKIGRRGSLNGRLRVIGTQGHAAYPQFADNPIPRLVRTLARLAEARLDDGTEHFEPSTLALTSIDVGNPATNVIPAEGRAAFNIRFNDRHTGAGLERWLRATCAELAGTHELAVTVSGEAFLTPPGRLSAILADAVRTAVGVEPALGTGGGTSDARFIKDVCPVAELGLVGRTMHKVDEHVPLADLAALTAIYAGVLDRFFAG
ncbi:MAG: succinyl-diaminopimelate desuccinylase [Alphaproteobacteria bacterium]